MWFVFHVVFTLTSPNILASTLDKYRDFMYEIHLPLSNPGYLL